MDTIPPELNEGTSGDGDVRADASLEDIIMAHRQRVQIIPRSQLHQELKSYVGRPIGEIPYDLIRQWMRGDQSSSSGLYDHLRGLTLLPRVQIGRGWY